MYHIYNLQDNSHFSDYETSEGRSLEFHEYEAFNSRTPEKYKTYLEWALNDAGGTFVIMINETMFIYEIL